MRSIFYNEIFIKLIYQVSTEACSEGCKRCCYVIIFSSARFSFKKSEALDHESFAVENKFKF